MVKYYNVLYQQFNFTFRNNRWIEKVFILKIKMFIALCNIFCTFRTRQKEPMTILSKTKHSEIILNGLRSDLRLIFLELTICTT